MFKQANQFIHLHDIDWLNRQRIAGRVASQALTLLKELVDQKTTLSLIELDALAEAFILRGSCTPTFKGYHGFPASVCISVNKQLVHGIPTDYVLQSGDLVSFDLGATYEGAIADTAITCIYGQPKSQQHVDLINTTDECLTKAIELIEIGKHIGCIGNIIYKHAKSKGYSVVDKFGGHGLSYNKPHAEPFINNKANINDGIRFQEGMTIAIEPLLVIGHSNETAKSNDGWTINSMDISAHFEQSLYIHSDHVEIISKRN